MRAYERPALVPAGGFAVRTNGTTGAVWEWIFTWPG